MAPKRKTKKAISNPARGFATTSTVSKTKLSPEESLGSTAPDEPQAQTITRDSPGDDAPVEKELHELSPEELEKQLEENDLQLFVEKYLDKIKRDVSRQVSRLQTEKRLLRPQAESLSTRKWLPPEILELIAQTLDAEQQPVRPDLKSQFYPITEALSEEDLCIKIWTLKRVLIQLGSSHEESEDAIKHLLKVAQSLSTRDSLVGKDNIWGLDWCLDWLAMHCEAHAMPSYVTDRVGENTTTDSVRHHQNDASIWSLRTSSTGSGLHYLVKLTDKC